MVHIACYLINTIYSEAHTFEAFRAHKMLSETKLKDMDDGARVWAPFVPLRPEEAMLDAMLIMGKYGVHRVPVCNREGVIVNIITQSAVVARIARVMPIYIYI